MKVKELIEKLQNLDPEKEVWYSFQCGGGHYLAYKIYNVGEARVGYESTDYKLYVLAEYKGNRAYHEPNFPLENRTGPLTKIRKRVILE